MTQIRVKSIVVEDKFATFWLEDGTTFTVNQGEARLIRMIEKATPIIKAGQIAVLDTEEVIVDTNEEPSTIFSGYEKRSGGFMKFFRAAKDAVKNLFHTNDDDYSNRPVAPKVPVMAIMPTAFEESAKPRPQVDKGMYAPVEEDNSDLGVEPEYEDDDIVEEISSLNVKPLTSDVVTANETVVAILPNGRTIPGMENLKSHLDHAKDPDQVEGLNKFVERMSVMLDKRAHSVDDLLVFMKRGDMPVTRDGMIIAYKVLNHANRANPKSGIYVDKHTGKVRQRVGSYVNVREDLVDKNRRNECSNGLHVARHGYLYAGSFSADKCFIILVAPEDVVTVPHGDPNKVRTMGYHIVAELPDAAYKLIKDRKPITEMPEMKALLAEIIKGNHVPRLESVQINGQKGENLKITPLGTREERLAWKFESTATEEEIQKAEAVTHIADKAVQIQKQEAAAKVDVKELAKKVEETKPENYRDRVLRALAEKDEAFILQLVERKRKSKKSWSFYDVSPEIGDKLVAFLKAAVDHPVQEPVKEQIADKVPQAPVVKQDAPKEPTFYEKVKTALAIADSKAAAELVARKRTAKKSWAAFGIGDYTAEQLIELAGKATPVVATPEPTPGPEPVVAVVVVAPPALDAPVKEWALYYYNVQDWQTLKNLKKSKKVSWERFGFTAAEIEEILKH